MHTELDVAIFDHASLSREAIGQAIFWQKEFAEYLPLITVFDRTSEEIVEARLMKLDEHGELADASCHNLAADLLRRTMPSRARWKVVDTPASVPIPESSLNDEFVSFLDVMMMLRTSAIFFVPPSPLARDYFIEAVKPTAAVVMQTAMLSRDLQALRDSLTSTRRNSRNNTRATGTPLPLHPNPL